MRVTGREQRMERTRLEDLGELEDTGNEEITERRGVALNKKIISQSGEKVSMQATSTGSTGGSQW